MVRRGPPTVSTDEFFGPGLGAQGVLVQIDFQEEKLKKQNSSNAA